MTNDKKLSNQAFFEIRDKIKSHQDRMYYHALELFHLLHEHGYPGQGLSVADFRKQCDEGYAMAMQHRGDGSIGELTGVILSHAGRLDLLIH